MLVPLIITAIILASAPARLQPLETDPRPFRTLEKICEDTSLVYHSSASISACTKLIHSRLGSPEDRAQIYKARARALVVLGEGHDAFEDFSEVVRLNPDDADALLRKAYLDPDSAQGFVVQNRLVRTRPNDPTVFEDRAYSYLSRGDTRRAEADFDVAIRLRGPTDPDLYGLYHNRGVYEFRAHDYAPAISHLSHSMALGSEVPELTLSTRGEAYLAVGDPRRALADFDAVLAMPGYEMLIGEPRAQALDALGRRGEAGLQRLKIWMQRNITDTILYRRDPREQWVRDAIPAIDQRVPLLTPYWDEWLMRCQLVSWAIGQKKPQACGYMYKLPVPRPL